MSERPGVVVFDVNETLSDMSALAPRFCEIGASASLLDTWFAAVLRDGFGLTAAGSSKPFAEVAASQLRVMLGRHVDGSVDEAVEHVMSGFQELPVHPDVVQGVRSLRSLEIPLVTLTNGSIGIADALLTRADIRADFDVLLSVEDAGAWKPAHAAYEYASRRCRVGLADMLMVAVHPWDIDGAARAGMRTTWINRSGGEYPRHQTAPDMAVSGLDELASILGAQSSV